MASGFKKLRRNCKGRVMKIEAGYDIAFACSQKMPMVLMLSVHPSRRHGLLTGHRMSFSPGVEARDYLDSFGNICTRLVAPSGLLEIRNRFVISDSGKPDEVDPEARQWAIDDLPDDTLVFLLGSRYCDTEKLGNLAWSLFGHVESGWRRVQAICDYVHDRIQFGYQHARGDRTAPKAMRKGSASVATLRTCDHTVPVHEYSRALLHGLSGRHRGTARSCAHGLQRLVRGVPRWKMVYLRRPAQPSPDWPDLDCPRP